MASLNICQTWFASNAMLLGTIFQRRVVDIVKGLPPPSKDSCLNQGQKTFITAINCIHVLSCNPNPVYINNFFRGFVLQFPSTQQGQITSQGHAHS